MITRLLIGDCRAILPTLEAASVHCCVTSPPYYGLRDYGVARQIGLESSPDAYIAELVAVFREVRRVLRDDATLWLNLGDSYSAHPGQRKTTDAAGPKQTTNAGAIGTASRSVNGLAAKQLLMIPARVAMALQADGWWLRSEIIWIKPNPMPESVTDRPTSAHEKIYLLTKSARYFYDAQAVAEAVQALPENSAERGILPEKGWLARERLSPMFGTQGDCVARDRGRSHKISGVESFACGDSSDSALFPVAQRPSRDQTQEGYTESEGTADGVHANSGRMGADQGDARPRLSVLQTHGFAADPRSCDSGQQGRQSRQGERRASVQVLQQPQEGPATRNLRNTWSIATQPFGEAHFATFPPELAERCIKAGCPKDGTVLDPFSGAGTTGLVADRLQRNAVLIELNPQYAAMTSNRIEKDAGMFAGIAP